MNNDWGVLIAAISGVAIVTFVFLGLLVVRSLYASSRKKTKTGSASKGKRETMKLVVWVCLANGFAWVWCSYILAFLDKMQIAESLSQVAVTQIIGVVLAYAIKSAIENLSKNNSWPDKPPVNPSDTTASSGDTGGVG